MNSKIRIASPLLIIGGLALLVLHSCMTPSLVATESVRLGNIENNRRNYDGAIAHYEKFLTTNASLGLHRDHETEADVNRKLAHAYSTQGKFARAEKCLLQAVAIDSIHGSVHEKIEDNRELGSLYAYKGEYQKALKYLGRAEQLGRGMESSIKDVRRMSIAETYLSLARLHLTLGNYSLAESFAWRSHAIFSENADRKDGITEALLVLGIVAREKHVLDKSEKFLQQSLDMARQAKLNCSRQLQAMGDLALLKGRTEDGIRYKISALEEARVTGIKPQIVMANMRLGDAYQKIGDVKKSASYYQKALAIQQETGADTSAFSTSLGLRTGDTKSALSHYERFGNAVGSALVSVRLGEFHLGKERYDSAKLFYEKAYTIFSQIKNDEGVATAGLGLARVFEKQDRLTDARQKLKEARSLSLQPDIQWEISYRLGRLWEKANVIDSAYTCYKDAIDRINEMRGNLTVEEFKSLFSNSKVEVYDHMIQLLLKNKLTLKLSGSPDETALAYSEQSRSVKDSTLLEEEQQLRLRIQQINRELVSAPSASRRELQQLLAQTQLHYDQTAQRIKLNNPAYSTMINVEPVSPALVQQKMDKGTAIVEFWVGEEKVVAWIIRKDGIRSVTTNISAAELQREVKGLRNSITMKAANVFKLASQRLYQKLVSPLTPHLSTVSNLIIVPHGPLHFVPFQALQTMSGKYMLENYVVTYAPSLSVLHYCMTQKRTAPKKLLAGAIGNESLNGFDALPATAVEVSTLGSMYKDGDTDHVIGKSFTESYFKTNASGYSILHLATHGVFNFNQPLFSYLLMNPSDRDDGLLTIDEIFSLELNSDMVALSACETALGDLNRGDELVGLSRAFIYAGAPSVIVSLWKVDDVSTAWLMERFHKYLLEGKSLAQSLTFAQRDLLKLATAKNKNANDTALKVDPVQASQPSNWAPFILIGDGMR
jgi:CHAT domain-containing protein